MIGQIAMLLEHPWLGPLVGAVLGLIFGSFIAAMVNRWPQGRSVLTGRSRCDGCGRTMTARELVPVLSWVVQRGQCRSCGARIGSDSLVIELLAALIGAVALVAAPGWLGLTGAVFGWLLLPLAWLDLRQFWLPDRLVAVLAAVGLMLVLAGQGVALQDALVGAIAGFLTLFLLALAYRRLRGREGLGQGDAKLLGAIGLWLGWQALPLVLVGASLIGLGWALLHVRSITAATHLPLGALMALAAFLIWLATAGGWVRLA